MKKTATFIKLLDDFNGVAKLYKLSEPVPYADGKETDYVIASAVKDSFVHETYIFPSNENGEVVDWGELDGSYKNGTSHETALENAGYTVELFAPKAS